MRLYIDRMSTMQAAPSMIVVYDLACRAAGSGGKVAGNIRDFVNPIC